MEARQPQVFVACGRRATGKTIETLDTIFQYIKGNPQKGIAGRKVLIFDVNNEFGKFKYKDGQIYTIADLLMKDLPAFTASTTPQVRRIRPVWDNGKRMSISDMAVALGQIITTFRDGMLLLEDVNKYTGDNMRLDLIGSLATIRQSGIDLFMHYQMVAKAGNPKLIGMTNYIRLHKTNDSVARHKDKFQDKFPIMMVAQNIVNEKYEYGKAKGIKDNTGEFYSLWIDMEYGKIRGNFSHLEAKKAIQDFISLEYHSTIAPLLRKRDQKGKKIHANYESAYQYLEKSMMNDFFDFQKTNS